MGVGGEGGEGRWGEGRGEREKSLDLTLLISVKGPRFRTDIQTAI